MRNKSRVDPLTQLAALTKNAAYYPIGLAGIGDAVFERIAEGTNPMRCDEVTRTGAFWRCILPVGHEGHHAIPETIWTSSEEVGADD